ncbi:MAG: DUF3090 family protein [Chloroflexi bacterium]|nr:DUF3090 family protein [Chloroflexota bacterium]
MPNYDFGPLLQIDADAVGVPGNRRFRLRARNEIATAVLWLEKEQLQALAAAIERLLIEVESTDPSAEGVAEPGPGEFSAVPAVEFRIGQLALGYDERRETFVIQAHDEEADVDGPPTFNCTVSRAQLRALSDRTIETIAAGRPRCVLCGEVQTPDHVCIRSNGHRKGTI